MLTEQNEKNNVIGGIRIQGGTDIIWYLAVFQALLSVGLQ